MFAIGSQGGEEAKELYATQKKKNTGGETEVLLDESPEVPTKPDGKIPSGYGPRARFTLQAAAARDAAYARMRRGALYSLATRQRLASIYVRYFRTKNPAD